MNAFGGQWSRRAAVAAVVGELEPRLVLTAGAGPPTLAALAALGSPVRPLAGAVVYIESPQHDDALLVASADGAPGDLLVARSAIPAREDAAGRTLYLALGGDARTAVSRLQLMGLVTVT